MAEFLSQLQPWHWLVLGLVLMGLETIAPGAFLLWPGLAAVVVGILSFALPVVDWQISVTLWAVLSLFAVVGWVMYRKKNPAEKIETKLNRRADQYVGRRFTLDKPVVNGKGEMRVDDTVWRIVSHADFNAGATVKVEAVEGTSLRVGPA